MTLLLPGDLRGPTVSFGQWVEARNARRYRRAGSLPLYFIVFDVVVMNQMEHIPCIFVGCVLPSMDI
jgi:hypothetical protein